MTKEEIERVEARLGDKIICETCAATLATYADRCNVPIDAECDGFLMIEEARKP